MNNGVCEFMSDIVSEFMSDIVRGNLNRLLLFICQHPYINCKSRTGNNSFTNLHAFKLFQFMLYP